MTKRRWPTVPEILARAATVIDADVGPWPFTFVDRETGATVKIHQATRPNVLSAIKSWKSKREGYATIYESPAAKTPA